MELGGAALRELTFGTEIETNVVSFESSRQRRATELLLDFPDKLDVEFDGSVSRGFEIVTGYGSYEKLRELLASLYGGHLGDGARYRFSNSTGAHIHIGRYGCGDDAMTLPATASAFEFLARFPLFAQLVSGRPWNRYCLALPYRVSHFQNPERLLESMHDDSVYSSRYLGLNVSRMFDGGTTVEWRSPRGTASYPTALARLQFIRILMTMSVAEPLVPIMAKTFVEKVESMPREETAALRRLLATRAINAQLLAHADPGNLQESCVPFAALPYNSRAEFVYCQPI